MTSRKRLFAITIFMTLLLSYFSSISIQVAAYSINLSFSDGVSERTVSPGGAVIYNLKIDNPVSTNQSEVNLTLMGVPVGWQANFLPDSNFTLANQSQTTRTLSLIIPLNTNANHAYEISIIADYRFVGDGDGSVSLSTTTHVRRSYGLNATSSTPEKQLRPNAHDGFDLKIANLGNGIETISFSVRNAPPNWTIIPPANVNIPPFSNVTTTVTCNVPSDAYAGIFYFIIRAKSENTTIYVEQTYIVYVPAIHNVTIRFMDGITQAVLRPGSSITFNLEVLNRGNVADEFNLSIIPFQGSNASWAKLTAKWVSIERGSIASVGLNITFPINALHGNHSFLVYAESLYDHSVNDTVNITVFAQQVGIIWGVSNNYELTGSPGEVVNFSLTLINIGNGIDVFHPQVIPIEDSRYIPILPYIKFECDNITLRPNEKYNLLIHVAIPENKTLLKANYYEMSIMIYSSINYSINRYFKFALWVKSVRELILSTDEASAIADMGINDAVWNLQVRNNGNGDDSATFQIEEVEYRWHKGWFKFNPDTLWFQFDRQSGTTVLGLDTDNYQDMDGGTYHFKVFAISGDGITKSNGLTLEVRLNKGELKIISLEILRKVIRVGDKVPVKIAIRNTGNVTSGISLVEVGLIFNEKGVGYSFIGKIEAGKEINLTIVWRPSEAITADLKARLEFYHTTINSTSVNVTVDPKENNPLVWTNIVPLIILLALYTCSIFAIGHYRGRKFRHSDGFREEIRTSIKPLIKQPKK